MILVFRFNGMSGSCTEKGIWDGGKGNAFRRHRGRTCLVHSRNGQEASEASIQQVMARAMGRGTARHGTGQTETLKGIVRMLVFSLRKGKPDLGLNSVPLAVGLEAD